jgi:hypothetical protein
MAPRVPMAWGRWIVAEHRSKRDTVRPCKVCGWAEHMAIHSLIKEGPRAGQPFDHAYVPPDEPEHKDGAAIGVAVTDGKAFSPNHRRLDGSGEGE